MSSDSSPQLWTAFRGWWHEQVHAKGRLAATSLLLHELWEFARDSTAERRQQRYGDMDYDWEQRVNTTAGTVGWRTRLLGVFHSPYQPTEPALFHEMMAALPIHFPEFTFIDIGSGKGRTLLMASEYPFKKIVGIELFSELDQAARKNILGYKSPTQQCATIEAVCVNARQFDLPDEPLVLYLFNPLPEAALHEFIARLDKSLAKSPRALWIVYHNPLLEPAFASSPLLMRAGATPQYALYRTVETVAGL